MLKILLKKLPLTFSAWALVGGYSLVRFGLNKIKQAYWRKNISSRSLMPLPEDIQNEILGHLLRQSTEKELLDLSLTCKNFRERISTSSSWLNERLEKYYAGMHIEDYITADQVGWPLNYETDLLGADRVFSPVLAYYFIRKRSDVPTSRLRKRASFSPNLAEFKNKNLYVPWLDHNLLKKPETFWQFIKTIVTCPEWMYTLIIAQEKRGRLSFRADPTNSPKIYWLFALLSGLLSYLPFLDTFLRHYRGLFSNLLAINSIYDIPSLLWTVSPLPFSDCLRILLNLAPSFIETTFVSPNATFARLSGMVLLYLASFNLKDLLIPLALLLAIVAISFLHYFPKLRSVASSLGSVIMVVLYGSLVYFRPIQSIFFLLLFGVEVLIMFLSGKMTENGPKLSRIPLLLSLPIVLSNLL